MIKVENKNWDKLTDSEKIAYCEGLLEDTKTGRQPREMEWYLNQRFVEGDHYISFNTVTNSLERPTPKRKEVRLVVNKVRSSIRAIQNYVTRSQPKWEVIPGDTDDDTIKNARRYGKVLDFVYRKLHLEQMVAGVVDSALNTSVGWVEIDWDSRAEKGLGQIRIRLHDTFDVYFDKRGYLYMGRFQGRFIAKTVTKSLSEIQNDERYNKKTRYDVKPDDTLAESELKARIVRKETGSEDKNIKRSRVKEFFFYDEEANNKGGNILKFTYAGDKVLLEEYMEEDEYPLYVYQVSMDPRRVYQRAWTSDAIPLNKALDRNMSQKVMYINQALVYRIIAEKGHGITVLTNEMGEVIEINKNRVFKQLEMQALPGTVDSLTGELSSYIEDILGAHDAALGRLPAGARSGKMVEALQAADANNLSNITQSLESFLSVIGERILNLIAQKYVTSRVVKIAEPEEGEDYMRVMGEKAPEGAKRKDALIITEGNELIVKIGSWLGYTKEGQRDTLMKLAEIGVIPAEEVLRQMEFPNVEDLSRKARDERLEQHQMDAEIAGRNPQGGAPAPTGPTPRGPSGQAGSQPNKDVAYADKENVQMMNGNALPPTEGASIDHTQSHLDFMNSKTFMQEADENIKKIFTDHVVPEAQANGLMEMANGGAQGAPQATPTPQPGLPVA